MQNRNAPPASAGTPSNAPSGPLSGFRVIEVAGIGAAPFCGMLLADMGAEVVRVDRVGARVERPEADVLARGRRSIAVDLKQPRGLEILLKLTDSADALFEAFRPGVAERLGFGPDVCLERNPKLVYGRMTGWGQAGPLARAAGHDLNYIALSGALHAIGPAGGKPVPPLNLVGDFGGGGMLLAFGMVCALLETQRSGQGQVVDAAMLDGALAQMAMFFGMRSVGGFSGEPGADLLSGAAPFYDTYETADGRYLAVGALEPQFFRLLLETLGIDYEAFAEAGFRGLHGPTDESKWPELRAQLEQAFLGRTRDEWCEIFEGSDACVAPVLTLSEVASHPHVHARESVIEVGGVPQPAPAPRFSRSRTGVPSTPIEPGSDTQSILGELGYSPERIEELGVLGAVAC